VVELENLNWYDKDIFGAIFKTIGNKKRINNITFFHFFSDLMKRMNSDPVSPFFK
jgi:hypothetical protein